jgi:hypothetical protein
MPTLIRRDSDRDVTRAERLVAEHADAIQRAWERLHGNH